jgi:O-antigen/teichoic acid export membrane protein
MFLIVVGLIISIVNTRYLSVAEYGDFKFLQNAYSFFATILTFGVFIQGSRTVALGKDENEQQNIIGLLVTFALIISVLLTLILLVFSFFEEKLFNNNLASIIRIFAPLLFAYPFQLCLDNILQGNNKIYTLSFFRLLPQVLYLLLAVLYNYFGKLSLFTALMVQFLALISVIVVTIVVVKPKFKNLKVYFSLLKLDYRNYGFPVYIGTLAGVASSQIGLFSISYFLDNINVGFYSLAQTITTPLAMIPGIVGTAFFKEFTNIDKIPKKVTITTVIMTICALVLFLLFAGKIVKILYTNTYSQVLSLSYLISLGSVLYGFGDYLNRFVGAKGNGKAIRNSNIAIGSSNIIGNILFVYIFGAMGAAITKIISGLIYVSMMIYSYKKIIKSTVKSPQSIQLSESNISNNL